jgi:hypothetical protein
MDRGRHIRDTLAFLLKSGIMIIEEIDVVT